MAILFIGSVLLGAVLGRFFKVLVLIPACALVVAWVLVGSADAGHGLRPLIEFAVLITSLQIGYVSGLLSFFIPSLSRRQGKPSPRASSATLKAAEKGAVLMAR